MKVLFSSNKNPHFETFTEYIEKAFNENGCETLFFENRDFIIPGRIRDEVSFLHQFDLRRLNRRLVKIAQNYRPDFFLEAGGWNTQPATVALIRSMGIRTALWTLDVPINFQPIRESAPYYDYIFTGGSEAYEILKKDKIKRLHLLSFACDPDFHRPVKVSAKEKKKYGCDICFVGSGGAIYRDRWRLLESLMDFNIGIWGPGWEALPSQSPLRKFIRGGQIRPEEWIKIFSASKIVFHSHFRDPTGEVPCYQAAPRVYEALACGAFLVVDRQQDLLRFFTPGEDLAVFDDVKALRELSQSSQRSRKDSEAGEKKGTGPSYISASDQEDT
jgi:spore maturation protein CgeB